MESKLPPGPWKFHVLQENRAGYPGWKSYCIRAANNCHLATVGNVDRYFETYFEDLTRLMTAAPELLDALESFLRAPSVGSDGPGSSTIVVQDFNIRAARAAIAAAKGEA